MAATQEQEPPSVSFAVADKDGPKATISTSSISARPAAKVGKAALGGAGGAGGSSNGLAEWKRATQIVKAHNAFKKVVQDKKSRQTQELLKEAMSSNAYLLLAGDHRRRKTFALKEGAKTPSETEPGGVGGGGGGGGTAAGAKKPTFFRVGSSHFDEDGNLKSATTKRAEPTTCCGKLLARTCCGVGARSKQSSAAVGPEQEDPIVAGAMAGGMDEDELIGLNAIAGPVKVPLLASDRLWRIFWDFFIIILVVVNALLLPVQLSEVVRSTSLVADTIVDFLFIFDIILNFCTPYRREGSHVWITSFARTSWRYLSSWFLLDFVSSIPVDLIVWGAAGASPGSALSSDTNSDNAASNLDVLRTAKLARLFKNLRLLRIVKAFRLGNSRRKMRSDVRSAAFRFVTLLLIFLFFLHCFGNFFLFVSNNFYDHTITAAWSWENSVHPLQQPDPIYQYLMGVYVSALLLFGGEIAVFNNMELLVTICIMLVGAVTHALLYGEVAHTVAELNWSHMRKSQKLRAVHKQLKSLDIGYDLSDRVARYYQYVWSTNNFFDRESFLEELSPALQDEVSLRISGRLVKKVPLFQALPPPCITNIVSRLKQHLYLIGDVLIHEGSFGREMYFVNQGRCEVVAGFGGPLDEIKSLATKTTVGRCAAN